jgi:hypothetical protein
VKKKRREAVMKKMAEMKANENVKAYQDNAMKMKIMKAGASASAAEEICGWLVKMCLARRPQSEMAIISWLMACGKRDGVASNLGILNINRKKAIEKRS